MKSVSLSLALVVLLPQVLIEITSTKTLAQPPQQNVRKEHLEFCVQQLTVQVGQLEAIKGVMSQENLSPISKLESVSQILSPQQKEQLIQCMQQPMPQKQG